ncbi:MAG TPA: serine/threonine-protein kinase [Gemmatimonadales bacterium]|nr:serine/threonine-protein kinase [Gemmatimonadales bacterium]
MSDPLRELLQTALGEGYRLERELGGGGMSRVFVATETGLGRRVVLKVLPPELAAGLSVDRFRREIQVAARLQHLHIVPLLSAGQAGEFLYYTMPFVEGESLRTRLARDGELPVPLAARIVTQVARALAYAHRHGIVHRDIKPDNILLSDDEAQVTDFGIAKALAASAEEGTLTAAGLAVGTPAYMAPEQATGDSHVDHRADLYALGVVAYEMLAGQAPFSGRTPQQLLVAHAVEPPPPLAARRPGAPAPLLELIGRLLAKRPADRPQTADEVARAAELAATLEAGTETVRVPPPPTLITTARRGPWVAAGAVAALVLVASVAWLTRREKPVTVDRNVIAVAPFRVRGADSSLAYLREGIVDLLAAKLAGTATLRPTDPRTLLSAWHRAAGDGDLAETDAAGVAARVGAGRLVQGEVVGTRAGVTINATVLDAPGGTVRGRASVEGAVDSLTRLVDQLAVKLLALGTGENEQRLNSLTSTSLAAVRAYLDGQAFLRGGRFEEAYRRYESALDLDSTFALAGLGHLRAGEWLGKGWQGRGADIAWRHRDRLSPRDRAHLEFFLGPKFPERRTYRETVANAERFVALAGDSPEAWHQLGDYLYHFGAVAGIEDAFPRARQAFDRALALDPSFALALEHYPVLAVELGDTAGAVRGLEALTRLDSASSDVTALRLYLAEVLGDTAQARLLAATDSAAVGFGRVLSTLTSQGIGAPYALGLTQRSRRAAITQEERETQAEAAYDALLLTGRPTAAAALVDSLRADLRVVAPLLDGLFAGGDSAAAARAAAAVERELATPVAPGDVGRAFARFALGQYALEHGRVDLARRIARQFRTAPLPRSALVLDAQLALEQSRGAADSALARLDSMLLGRASPRAHRTELGFSPLLVVGNLVAARLHSARGAPDAALQALRRRIYDFLWIPAYVTYYREEGRLAALTGDRAGAVRAYQRYLRIRADPEPRLRPQRDSVLGELQALERESPDRP